MFKANDNKVVGNNNSKTNEIIVNLSKNNKSRNSIYISNIKAIEELIFLTLNAKKTFNYLK